MHPPCSIEQLPNELLLCIFEWLPWRNLLQATLVCSRWNSLIGSSSTLMDNVALRVGRRKKGNDQRDTFLAYGNYLGRSVRRYRNLVIRPDDVRSYAAGLLALRKLGPHLRELSLESDIMAHIPYHRIREFELGLDEGDRTAWDQVLHRELDRCLLPIDEYYRMESISPGVPEYVRELKELLYAITNDYCFLLEMRTVKDPRRQEQYLTRYKEMCAAGHLYLAKSPSLRLLRLYRVKAGPPFYASLGHTFPMLTHLEIRNDKVFDDPCLWAVSQHCSQIKLLDLASDKLTEHGLRYMHQLRKLKNLSITLNSFGCRDTFDVPEAPPLEILFIRCHEAKLENIHRMFDLYVNLKEFRINAVRYTYAGHEANPSPLVQELRAIRPTCIIDFFLVEYYLDP